MSDSSRPHGLQPTRLLRPWDFPGKSTGVGCHCLLRYALLMCDKLPLKDLQTAQHLERSFCLPRLRPWPSAGAPTPGRRWLSGFYGADLCGGQDSSRPSGASRSSPWPARCSQYLQNAAHQPCMDVPQSRYVYLEPDHIGLDCDSVTSYVMLGSSSALESVFSCVK